MLPPRVAGRSALSVSSASSESDGEDRYQAEMGRMGHGQRGRGDERTGAEGHCETQMGGIQPAHLRRRSDASDIERLAPAPEAAAAVPGAGSNPGGPPALPDLYQPRSLRFWLTLVSNFLALFLVALDRTIVATAIPRITDDFHSLGDIGWYGSIYMLTTAASQLLFGRIYRFYPMKLIFLSCVLIFEVGSAICGAAPSSAVFIFGRAISGLASAGIFSGAMLIMVPMIPLHRRPMFQGLFGMVFGLASVVGPLVGGAFTSSSLTWRWCFYINLPVGGFTLIFMFFFWNPPKKKQAPASAWVQFKRLDPLGSLFFLPGVTCLLLALQWGGSTYAWDSWVIIPLFVLFGALMFAFTLVQILMPETATLPGRVVRQRSILSGALFTFFISASMLMMVYYVPIWFQTAKMVDPLKSGIYTLPIVLAMVVSSLVSGMTIQKIGYYVPSMLASPSIMSIGQGLMSTFTPDTGSNFWISYQFLAGFGLGLGMQIGNLAAQTVLPMEDLPTGIAIMFFVQQLGGAVFTAVGQALLNNLLSSRLRDYNVPGINPDAIVSAGATELARVVPPEYVPIVAEAYNYASTRIFITAMGLTLMALVSAFPMEWRSVKKGRQMPPGGKGMSLGVKTEKVEIKGPDAPSRDDRPAVGVVGNEKQFHRPFPTQAPPAQLDARDAAPRPSSDYSVHSSDMGMISIVPWQGDENTSASHQPRPSSPVDSIRMLANLVVRPVSQLLERAPSLRDPNNGASRSRHSRHFSSSMQDDSVPAMEAVPSPPMHHTHLVSQRSPERPLTSNPTTAIKLAQLRYAAETEIECAKKESEVRIERAKRESEARIDRTLKEFEQRVRRLAHEAEEETRRKQSGRGMRSLTKN